MPDFKKTNLKGMMAAYGKRLKKRFQAAAKAQRTRKQNVSVTAGKLSGKKIIKSNPPLKWEKFDLRGKPLISFQSSRKDRKKMIAILALNSKSREKKRLIEKLQSEFMRLYTRYRKMILRELGKNPSFFIVPETEKKFAAKAAVSCIQQKVFPKHLFQYWHNRVANLYGGSRMQIPPLTFLSSDFGIATVARATLEDIEKPLEDSVESIFGNAYGELKNLNPKVRPTLDNAGFNTQQFNDRELISIQAAAIPLAKGVSIFIDEDVLPMAQYLADTVYRGWKE